MRGGTRPFCPHIGLGKPRCSDTPSTGCVARKWTTAIYTSLTRTQAGALQDKNSLVLRLQLIKMLANAISEGKNTSFVSIFLYASSCFYTRWKTAYVFSPGCCPLGQTECFWKEEGKAIALKKDKV